MLRMNCDREMQDPALRFIGLLVSPPNRNLKFRSVEQFDRMLNRKRGKESGASNPVGNRPFKHVVLILCESLSLDFIDRDNPRHPPGLTPFLDSLPASPDQVWTISSPTSKGIATHLCSHPNAEGLFALGFPHSIVRAFDSAGWRTAIFRSSDGDFDQGVLRFKQMGFREQFDSKWLTTHREGVQGLDLGVCDQMTFEALADYWAAHREERTFMSILTVDTHMPTGRLNYGDLKYPEEPGFVANDLARLYLRAVFRFDVTLERFFGDLKRRGLLDEDSVVIITADHSCPPFPTLMNRMGMNRTRYERIPWIVFSTRKEFFPPEGRLGTQCDTAPTLAQLTGLEADPAWWGDSLYEPRSIANVVRIDAGVAYCFDPGTGGFVQSSDSRLREALNSFVPEKRQPGGD